MWECLPKVAYCFALMVIIMCLHIQSTLCSIRPMLFFKTIPYIRTHPELTIGHQVGQPGLLKFLPDDLELSAL